MERIVKGSRERLTGVLRELAEGWAHFGKAEAAIAALSAVDHLAAGAAIVRAGHTEYRVEETDAA